MDTASEFQPQLLPALLLFLGVFAVGLVVRFVVVKWVARLSARTKTRLDDIILNAVKGPLLLWFALLGLNLASRLLHHDLKVQLWIDRFSLVAWIISLTWAASRFAGDVINEYSSKKEGGVPVTSLTRNLTRITIVILGGLFILQIFGISITPIITALGIGGLAVALALQDTLNNLFSGMYLMAARQVRLGDYVKLDSGQEGYVTDITWRTTTIKSLTNNCILVPNSKMAQAIITNYYLPDTPMALSIPVSVSYSADPDQVERILVEEALLCADTVAGMLKDPPPIARFNPGFGESSLQFTLICQIREFTDQYLVGHELRKRILKRFRAEGIEIPLPLRALHIPEGVHVLVEAKPS